MSKNVSMTTTKAYSVLYTAISRNEPAECILNLIETDDMVLQQSGILHVACRYPDYDSVIMKILDIYPIAAQQKSNDGGCGEYPLHAACRNGRSESVIRKLIEIFPEAAAVQDWSKRYPLHLACQHIKSQWVIGKLIEIYPAALQEKAGYSSYPIHYAVGAKQSIEVIQLILDANSSVLQQKDKYGRTPFHLACMENAIRAPLVECFLQCPNIGINLPDFEGLTALHLACLREEGADVIVPKLLQHPDINVNAKDYNDDTPLHYVVRNGNRGYYRMEQHIPVIRMLLDHPSIDVNQKNKENDTPMDLVNKMIPYLEKHYREWMAKHELPIYLEIKRLFDEEFPQKRKWREYQYFRGNVYHKYW